MFGQVVIGLANSGKSTYCKTVAEYLKQQGRKVKIINLDPGVYNMSYECDIDICDLICVEEIMKKEDIGPNESLVFAMDFILQNMEKLVAKMSQLSNDSYLIIDLPGQVELYTNYDHVPKILSHLTDPKGLDYRLTAVFLAESIYCQTPESYISILYTTLSTMLQIALPQVNILSKSRLLSRDDLPFKVEDYLEVKHLEYLVDHIKVRKNSKMRKMYSRIVDAIVDLPWHGFSLFDCEDEDSVKDVTSQVDLANGYVVKQKFVSLLDEKHSEREKQLDDAADELVEKFF